MKKIPPSCFFFINAESCLFFPSWSEKANTVLMDTTEEQTVVLKETGWSINLQSGILKIF